MRSAELIDLTKQFDIQQGKHTLVRYTGPRDPESIHSLYIFLRQRQWRGRLAINFTGNGGVTDITFTDAKAEVVSTVK